ncbi:transport permease protein [Actinocatenispora thailandica]|uniref:Transport permease protein n=1 Tax=Actinocatenispora thailandica TaxID=227318 RepID=A0A7R7DNV4_9ACTN|nr:ABC transporter permease [Actinocatenispora thailandica]BCJ35021.1 transport permease protein [Actinocatenispora thailandica]
MASVAVPAAHRLGPWTAVQHCFTLAWRNLVQLKSNPGELAGFIIQPLVFIVLFVYVFGGAIAGTSGSYLQYVLPGLIAQSGVFSIMATGAGLNQDITNGVFDRLRSLPIARSAPLVGRTMGELVRFAASLVILLAFGMLIGFRVHTNPLEVAAGLLLVLAFGVGLAWVSMLIGLLAKSATTVQLFSGVLMFPITFGSNVMVPTSTMPGWLQAWADVNPVSHLSTAVRGLLTGTPLGSSVWWSLGWSVLLTAVFAPLAIAAYRRKV